MFNRNDFGKVTSDMIKLVNKYKSAGGCVGACHNGYNANGICFGVSEECPLSETYSGIRRACSPKPDPDSEIKTWGLFRIDSGVINEFLYLFITTENIEED